MRQYRKLLPVTDEQRVEAERGVIIAGNPVDQAHGRQAHFEVLHGSTIPRERTREDLGLMLDQLDGPRCLRQIQKLSCLLLVRCDPEAGYALVRKTEE